MITTAVVTGSFDPITVGHKDIVLRAAALFDRVVVLMGINAEKEYLFSEQTRIDAVRACFPDKKIRVACYDGYLFDYARRFGHPVFVRGIRGEADLAYETALREENKKRSGIDTLFFPADPALEAVSSTAVREYIAAGKALTDLVPAEAIRILEREL